MGGRRAASSAKPVSRPSCAMPDGPDSVSEDRLLDGRVRLLQPRRGHRAGSDAVLLAAAVQPQGGETVVDLGAGTGAVGLMMAALSDAAEVILVERDPALVELCRRNIALNGLDGRARAIEADILAPAGERRARGLVTASADVVVTNPPFLEAGRSRASPDPGRAAAHQLPDEGLEQWIAAAADLLRPKGRLALIHRADRLSECLRHLEQRFGGITVKAVHARADEAAIRIVVTAMKGSHAPLRMTPPLVLHGPDNRFTPEAEAIHRGEAALHMQNGRP
jgi:tRNA1(Val) A37 N6-methylase TrmN6